MELLDHVELSIVKGVGPAPGDTASNEQPLVIVDLLDNGAGFALEEWTPNIPSLKSGGLWADSPISAGRSLIAGVNTNVTEKIVLVLTSATPQPFAMQFSKLQRMIQDCHDFWDSFDQIEPVYIRWWANGAPGPQFALIYTIELDVEWFESDANKARITIEIEREVGWRGVRPGGNPKEWTYYVRDQLYSSAVAALTTGSDHLVNATIQNRREWNGAQSALLSQNFFDIPAASIPGDLDALVCMSVVPSAGTRQVFYGRTTKPDLMSGGAIRRPVYTLNAGDALAGTDTTIAADTGAPLSGAGATAQRGATTFATATTDTLRLLWTAASRGLFDFTSMRGRFAVFVRARLSAASSVTLHLRITVSATITIDFPIAILTDVGSSGTGNTTAWGVAYLGTLAFPLSDVRIPTDDNGLGVTILTGATNYTIGLYAARTGGATNLYVSDLIFVPIDEAGGAIDAGPGNGTLSAVADTTGHFLHGRPDAHAHMSGIVEGVQQNGAPLTLKPGVQNRIILFGTNNGIPTGASIADTYTVRMNIVPCWAGVRDV